MKGDFSKDINRQMAYTVYYQEIYDNFKKLGESIMVPVMEDKVYFLF